MTETARTDTERRFLRKWGVNPDEFRMVRNPDVGQTMSTYHAEDGPALLIVPITPYSNPMVTA